MELYLFGKNQSSLYYEPPYGRPLTDPTQSINFSHKYDKIIKILSRELIDYILNEVDFEEYYIEQHANHRSRSQLVVRVARDMITLQSRVDDTIEVANEIIQSSYMQGIRFANGNIGRMGFGVNWALLPIDHNILEILYSRQNILLNEIFPEYLEDAHEIIAESYMEGLSWREASRRLQAELEKYSKVKADRIAHTEVMYALNTAQKERYIDVGIDVVQWLTAEDERVCQYCAALDGHRFSLSGDTPGYDKIPNIPYHVHCRCTFIAFNKYN